jgi:hypothetical protein
LSRASKCRAAKVALSKPRAAATPVRAADRHQLLLVLVLEAELIEQLQTLDVGEGRLLVEGDAVLVDGQRHPGLAQQDVEAGLLGEDGVPRGVILDGRPLGLQERETLLGLAAVEQGLGLEQ